MIIVLNDKEVKKVLLSGLKDCYLSYSWLAKKAVIDAWTGTDSGELKIVIKEIPEKEEK